MDIEGLDGGRTDAEVGVAVGRPVLVNLVSAVDELTCDVHPAEV